MLHLQEKCDGDRTTREHEFNLIVKKIESKMEDRIQTEKLKVNHQIQNSMQLILFVSYAQISSRERWFFYGSGYSADTPARQSIEI